MEKSNAFFVIGKEDNVAVALRDTVSGETYDISGERITLAQDIPAGHKVALRPIPAGSDIIKYGCPIGHALTDIERGSHVHTHNIKTNLEGVLAYTYHPAPFQAPGFPALRDSFDGYLRPDGRVGTRNEIWIINTVGCVNGISQTIAEEANRRFAGMSDGVFAYTHPYGCSQCGEDLGNTTRLLARMAKHPNAGGVLVFSLGCEYCNLEVFKRELGDYDEKRVRFLCAQDFEDEVEKGLELIGELCEYTKGCKRTPQPVSALAAGLKCGGSDGFSGITANPIVGIFSDMLISKGGSAILTEVPEMFGAETILMDRCADRETFLRTVDMINGYKEFFIKNGLPVYENPSPGNKAGGISTLEDKSLGCTQKCGRSPVMDVLDYAQPLRKTGLSLLNSPSNDLVASTAEMAAGAQIILFTTGRGTPYGCAVPTLKIASNSRLFNKKRTWHDFNAGRLLEGEEADALALELYNLVLDCASGKLPARNEANRFREIAIFKSGVTQ